MKKIVTIIVFIVFSRFNCMEKQGNKNKNQENFFYIVTPDVSEKIKIKVELKRSKQQNRFADFTSFNPSSFKYYFYNNNKNLTEKQKGQRKMLFITLIKYIHNLGCNMVPVVYTHWKSIIKSNDLSKKEIKEAENFLEKNIKNANLESLMKLEKIVASYIDIMSESHSGFIYEELCGQGPVLINLNFYKTHGLRDVFLQNILPLIRYKIFINQKYEQMKENNPDVTMKQCINDKEVDNQIKFFFYKWQDFFVNTLKTDFLLKPEEQNDKIKRFEDKVKKHQKLYYEDEKAYLNYLYCRNEFERKYINNYGKKEYAIFTFNGQLEKLENQKYFNNRLLENIFAYKRIIKGQGEKNLFRKELWFNLIEEFLIPKKLINN